MTTTPDPIAEFYNQNAEDEWQRLERHRTMGGLQRREGEQWVPTWTRTLGLIDIDRTAVWVSWLEEETLANISRGRMERATQCLPKCDPERLLRLMRGEESCGVL